MKIWKVLTSLALCAALLIGAIAGVAAMGSRFYNPFH